MFFFVDCTSLYLAVSAWNDNGQAKLARDRERLYRSDFFPGLGWMMNRYVCSLVSVLMFSVYACVAINQFVSGYRYSNSSHFSYYNVFGYILLSSRRIWEELSPKWPRAYWDDWLREPAQRKGRHTIRPEVR